MAPTIRQIAVVLFCFLLPGMAVAQVKYDLLLRGGHLIDPKNQINAVRDLAILDGKVAAVAERIDPAEAFKVVDASGLYVTPGLIDIHVHVYTERANAIPTLGTTACPRTGSLSAWV